jgi:hypothetical protein
LTVIDRRFARVREQTADAVCPSARFAIGVNGRTQIAMQYQLRQVLGRLQHTVIRLYDAAGNVIETHEHEGEFKDW